MFRSSMLLAILSCATAMAQPPKKDADEDPSRPTNAGSAFLVSCESQPNKVIVLDSTGKWVSTVKSIEIKFDIGAPATLVCVCYEGNFKPTKPQVKSWNLVQIKTVGAAEFQQMVDAVQGNPDAFKDMLKRGD